jgi:hypothetical protein
MPLRLSWLAELGVESGVGITGRLAGKPANWFVVHLISTRVDILGEFRLSGQENFWRGMDWC